MCDVLGRILSAVEDDEGGLIGANPTRSIYDSTAMTEAAMSNPALYDGLVELLAKVTAIVHGKQAA